MKREIDESLISRDKLMSSNDLAKLGCNDCAGCSDCCRDRAGAVTLDAWDIKLLKEGLNYSFEGLLNAGLITLFAEDSAVLPALTFKKEPDECVFLDSDGRCGIHDFRPGICRMFPLARLWHEDGSFSYFLQPGECSHSSGVKIRISKWLGYKNIREYEEAVRIYHDALCRLREEMRRSEVHEDQVRLQRSFLEEWFIR